MVKSKLPVFLLIIPVAIACQVAFDSTKTANTQTDVHLQSEQYSKSLPYADTFPYASVGNTWVYSATYLGSQAQLQNAEFDQTKTFAEQYVVKPVSATFLITDKVISVNNSDKVWGAEIQRRFELIDVSAELLETDPNTHTTTEFFGPSERYDTPVMATQVFRMPSDYVYSYVITDSTVYKQAGLDLVNIKARRAGNQGAYIYPLVLKLPLNTDEKCWFPGTSESSFPCANSRDAHFSIVDGPFEVHSSLGIFNSCYTIEFSGFRVSFERIQFCEGIGFTSYEWRYNSMRGCCINPETGMFNPLENKWRLVHYSLSE